MSAWKVIGHTEVGAGGAANIAFNSIPGIYTDLVILLSVRGNQSSTWDWLTMQFNGVASDYSSTRVYGTGSGVSANIQSISSYFENGLINGNTSTANTFSSVLINISNYAGNKLKSVTYESVSENNATTEAYALKGASLWSNTAAITSIVLDSSAGGTWLQHSSATLYGITKGTSGGVTVS